MGRIAYLTFLNCIRKSLVHHASLSRVKCYLCIMPCLHVFSHFSNHWSIISIAVVGFKSTVCLYHKGIVISSNHLLHGIESWVIWIYVQEAIGHSLRHITLQFWRNISFSWRICMYRLFKLMNVNDICQCRHVFKRKRLDL